MPVHLARKDFLASSGAGAFNTDSSVTNLGHGKYVVTWTRGSGTAADIVGQVYNVAGHAVGHLFQVNGIGGASATSSTVAKLKGGGFVVAWASSDTGDGDRGCIRAQRFSDSGAKIGKSIIVNSTGTGVQSEPEVAPSADGGFAVAWSTGTKYYYKEFQADGDPSTSQQVLGSSALGPRMTPSISLLPGGNHIAVIRSGTTDVAINGKIIKHGGTKFNSTDLNISTADEVDYTYNFHAFPKVATLTDGHFAATWYAQQSEDIGFGPALSPGIYARVFTTQGTGQKVEFQVTSYEDTAAESPVVAAISHGRFVVAWLTRQTGTDQFGLPAVLDNGDVSTVKARIFYSDGKAAGKEFTVVFDDKFNVSNLEVAALGGDKFVVSWSAKEAASHGKSQIHTAVYRADTFDGTARADHWLGGIEADLMKGAAGNDVFSGGAGNDRLFGGTGNDTLAGGAGRDRLDGGQGSDTASYSSQGALTLALDHSKAAAGSAAGDRLVSIENLTGSSTGYDTLIGDAGNNTLRGLGGDDKLDGRAGDDILEGGRSSDLLFGGAGKDMASYANETAIVFALDNSLAASGAVMLDTLVSIEGIIGSNRGDDEIAGNAKANTLSGLGGKDILHGRAGNDVLLGGAGRDLLEGGAGADHLDGGQGFDFAIYYYEQAVTVSLDGSRKGTGAAAGDTFAKVEGLQGSQTGGDTLVGSAAANTIFGGGGDDKLYGQGGNDFLSGGAGKEFIDGGSGNDVADYSNEAAAIVALDGAFKSSGSALGDVLVSIESLNGSITGNDQLRGNSGDNSLYGNDGNDRLSGMGGEDFLFGGGGRDALAGGAGNDQFYFSDFKSGSDTIKDFTKGDLIVLSGTGFFGVPQNGFLDDGILYTKTNFAPSTYGSSNVFLFNKTNHSFWYDTNGGLAGGSHLIAKFANGYLLHWDEVFLST